MGDGGNEPRWFYVGNGQLRRKDENGWTDEYQDLDGPKKTAVATASDTVDAPNSAGGGPARGRGARALSALGALSSAAAHTLFVALKYLGIGFWRLLTGLWRLVAKGCRKALARLSAANARRSSASPSSGLPPSDAPGPLQGVKMRTLGQHPRHGRHRSSARADVRNPPVP